MAALPWYKCDPARFNDGMVGLTRSERGVYITVINCIYIEGGPVKDQPAYWAATFGCSEAAWMKDRDGLIAKGKLFVAPTADGLPGLMNGRASREIDNQFAFKSKQAQHGKKGGKISRKKSRSDKGLSRPSGNPKATLRPALGNPKPIEIEKEIKNPPYPVKEATDSQEEALGEAVVKFPGRGA